MGTNQHPIPILIIGAHADDIALALAATIHNKQHQWKITTLTLSHTTIWNPTQNLKKTETQTLKQLGTHTTIIKNNKPTKFHKNRQKIYNQIKKTIQQTNPQIIYTHHPDTNQDHNTTHEETIRNLKHHTIYLYTPHPIQNQHQHHNTYTPITPQNLKAKLKAIKQYTKKIGPKPYLNPQLIKAQATYHGSNTPTGLAEAYTTHTQIIQN